MQVIAQEAANFIKACEAIHELLHFKLLAPSDKQLIEMSATNLLSKLKAA
jgi:hypothetical protein